MLTKKAVVFFFGVFLLLLTGLPVESSAGVNVNIGINVPLPPPFRFHAPPPMAVIPGTYIYTVPDIDVEILFYQGYWYRPYEGRWYRSKSYNGPWAFLDSGRVPHTLFDLSPRLLQGTAGASEDTLWAIQKELWKMGAGKILGKK